MNYEVKCIWRVMLAQCLLDCYWNYFGFYKLLKYNNLIIILTYVFIGKCLNFLFEKLYFSVYPLSFGKEFFVIFSFVITDFRPEF